MRLRRPPELLDNRLPVVGCDRHHRRLGALRHVLERRACCLRRPRLRRRRGRGKCRQPHWRFLRLYRPCRPGRLGRWFCNFGHGNLRLDRFRFDCLRRRGRKALVERKQLLCRNPGCCGADRGGHRRLRRAGRPGIGQSGEHLIDDGLRVPGRDGQRPFHHMQIEIGATQGRIDARSENIAVDRPGTRQHEADDGDGTEKIIRAGLADRTSGTMGREIMVERNASKTHSPCIPINPTCSAAAFTRGCRGRSVDFFGNTTPGKSSAAASRRAAGRH